MTNRVKIVRQRFRLTEFRIHVPIEMYLRYDNEDNNGLYMNARKRLDFQNALIAISRCVDYSSRRLGST